MNGGVLAQVLDWLRAGYPEGVPPKDYTPLLALLRRTLNDEELAQVVAAIEQQDPDPVRVSHIRDAIAEVTSITPGDEEIHRVASTLAAKGRPLSGRAQRIATGEAEPVDGAPAPRAASAHHAAAAHLEEGPDAGVITQALRWLSAGYPDGIPAADRVPILALLRRRLTDQEVGAVADAVVAQAGSAPEVSLVDAQVLMMKTLGELPSAQDVERVRTRLGDAGRTLV